MLLADSRASFEIEGERPARNRLERWGRAVMLAGRNRLTLDEIIRLHGILIEDARFVHLGLRPEGVFLGERDHNGDSLPEFIGARPGDLPDLMSGLIDANDRMRDGELDPVRREPGPDELPISPGVRRMIAARDPLQLDGLNRLIN